MRLTLLLLCSLCCASYAEDHLKGKTRQVDESPDPLDKYNALKRIQREACKPPYETSGKRLASPQEIRALTLALEPGGVFRKQHTLFTLTISRLRQKILAGTLIYPNSPLKALSNLKCCWETRLHNANQGDSDFFFERNLHETFLRSGLGCSH